MTTNLRDVFKQHDLSVPEFGKWMAWPRATAHRKLDNERAWTLDEIERAAMWMRTRGVPLTDGDVRQLVRTA